MAAAPEKLESVSAAPAPDYLARWLLITGVLFAGSAALYVRKAAAKRPSGASAATAPRVLERVDVAQGRQVMGLEPERREPRELHRAGVARAHRHAGGSTRASGRASPIVQ